MTTRITGTTATMTDDHALTPSSTGRRRQWVRPARLGLGATLLAVAAYPTAIRPWHLRWGTTDEEVTRVLPGDDFVPTPTFTSTRAITIHAPPTAVWPWLVQIGNHRAGWYSYDWIERLLGA